MRIYLVQHGEAVDKSVDSERPLSSQGTADVESIASVLARAGAAPKRILHSGKTRARQTAEILNQALSAPSAPSEISGIAPMDPVAEFAARLPDFSAETMVCGHQPFMGRMVSHLLTGNEERPVVEYSPGSVVCLERSAEDDWVLCWFLRPELCRVNV